MIKGAYANNDQAVMRGLPINGISKGLGQRHGRAPSNLGGDRDSFNTADAPSISGGQRTIFGKITLSAGCVSCKDAPIIAYWAQELSVGQGEDHSWLYFKDSLGGEGAIIGTGSEASRASFVNAVQDAASWA